MTIDNWVPQVGDYVRYSGSRASSGAELAVITKIRTLQGVRSVRLRLEGSGREVTTVMSCLRPAEPRSSTVGPSSHGIGEPLQFLGRSGRWVDAAVVGHDDNDRVRVRLDGYNGTIAPDPQKLRRLPGPASSGTT